MVVSSFFMRCKLIRVFSRECQGVMIYVHPYQTSQRFQNIHENRRICSSNFPEQTANQTSRWRCTKLLNDCLTVLGQRRGSADIWLLVGMVSAVFGCRVCQGSCWERPEFNIFSDRHAVSLVYTAHRESEISEQVLHKSTLLRTKCVPQQIRMLKP